MDPFTLKILCSFGPHCAVLLASPVVSVCCLCFTWQESGTTLWLCLLFCNTLGSPTQDTTGSANRWREMQRANERPGAGAVTTNQLLSLSLSLLCPVIGQNKTRSLQACYDFIFLYSTGPTLQHRLWTSSLCLVAGPAATGQGTATVVSKRITVTPSCRLELS